MRFRLVRKPGCQHERTGASAFLTTIAGVKSNALRQGPEGRDRAGFNGHPDLIAAVKLLRQSESGRQVGLQMDFFSGDGVLKV